MRASEEVLRYSLALTELVGMVEKTGRSYAYGVMNRPGKMGNLAGLLLVKDMPEDDAILGGKMLIEHFGAEGGKVATIDIAKADLDSAPLVSLVAKARVHHGIAGDTIEDKLAEARRLAEAGEIPDGPEIWLAFLYHRDKDTLYSFRREGKKWLGGTLESAVCVEETSGTKEPVDQKAMLRNLSAALQSAEEALEADIKAALAGQEIEGTEDYRGYVKSLAGHINEERAKESEESDELPGMAEVRLKFTSVYVDGALAEGPSIVWGGEKGTHVVPLTWDNLASLVRDALQIITDNKSVEGVVAMLRMMDEVKKKHPHVKFPPMPPNMAKYAPDSLLAPATDRNAKEAAEAERRLFEAIFGKEPKPGEAPERVNGEDRPNP